MSTSGRTFRDPQNANKKIPDLLPTRTRTASEQHVVVDDDDTGPGKHKRHVASDHVLTADELAEDDAHVALQTQKVRQPVDGRRRLGVDEHDAARVQRRQRQRHVERIERAHAARQQELLHRSTTTVTFQAHSASISFVGRDYAHKK